MRNRDLVDPSEMPGHTSPGRMRCGGDAAGAKGTYFNHVGDEGKQRVREAHGASYTQLAALKKT